MKLRECPFCGGAEISVRDKSRYDFCVRCANCNSQTEWLPTIADAVTAWNTRPDSWISVEERLPDTTTVLGCNIEGFVATVLYMSNAKRWVITTNMSVIMDVTHWMPLPEPPKGDEN